MEKVEGLIGELQVLIDESNASEALELLREFREIYDVDRKEIREYKSLEKELLEEYIKTKDEDLSDEYDRVKRERLDKMIRSTNVRNIFVEDIAWSIPTEEAIQTIIDFVGEDTVLEIGSGHGIWAALLQEKSNIIPTDDFSWKEKEIEFHLFTDVYNMDGSEAISSFPDAKVLMLIWPPPGGELAEEVTKRFKGDKLIFGCIDHTTCGNEEFFQELEQNWHLVKVVEFPTWHVVESDLDTEDHLEFYIRKL